MTTEINLLQHTAFLDVVCHGQRDRRLMLFSAFVRPQKLSWKVLLEISLAMYFMNGEEGCKPKEKG